MPEDFYTKIEAVNVFLNHFNLSILKLEFHHDGDWEIMCTDNLCNKWSEADIRLSVSFDGNEINSVYLQRERYYLESETDECRSKNNQIFDQTLYLHRVFNSNKFYQLINNRNKILGYYFKDASGKHVEIKDLDDISISFSDDNLNKDPVKACQPQN